MMESVSALDQSPASSAAVSFPRRHSRRAHLQVYHQGVVSHHASLDHHHHHKGTRHHHHGEGPPHHHNGHHHLQHTHSHSHRHRHRSHQHQHRSSGDHPAAAGHGGSRSSSSTSGKTKKRRSKDTEHNGGGSGSRHERHYTNRQQQHQHLNGNKPQYVSEQELLSGNFGGGSCRGPSHLQHQVHPATCRSMSDIEGLGPPPPRSPPHSPSWEEEADSVGCRHHPEFDRRLSSFPGVRAGRRR